MFGYHPANLAFRFALEISALAAIGIGIYNLFSGFLAWILAIGLPLITAVAWGTFNVPGDDSRSGNAPVAVAGVVRLAIELLVFSAAVVLLIPVSLVSAVVLGLGVTIHYMLSIDRIRWLLAH